MHSKKEKKIAMRANNLSINLVYLKTKWIGKWLSSCLSNKYFESLTLLVSQIIQASRVLRIVIRDKVCKLIKYGNKNEPKYSKH